MLKTRKIKILSALFACVTASLAVALFAGAKRGETVYAAGLTVDGVKTEYLYNDTMSVPKTATLTIDGKEYESDSYYVVLPDGSRVAETKLTLNECGEYSIVYLKTLADKRYSATKTFSVKKRVYELTSGSNSIEYGKLNNQFEAMGYTDGLKIGLAEGDVFALNKPFNIYEHNLEDVISFNCMQTEPVLCNFITLRLTDCYDPSIYLDIMYKRFERYYSTTITAGTCGGKMVGLAQNQQGNVKVGDKAFEIDKNGTTVYGNNPDNGNYSNLSYYLDTTDVNKIKIYVRVGNGTSNALVSEINNDKAYQYKFKGFTDGNVFLSLTASSLVGVNEAPVQIAKLGDYAGRDFLTVGYYNDETGPIFSPNSFEREYKVAVGKEVSVPEVKIKDDYGVKGLCDYSVVYEKNTSDACNVSVKNGKFVPDRKGAYTVDYYATDVYGNKSELSLNLYAVEAADGIYAERKLTAAVSAGERHKLSDIVSITSLNAKILNVKVTVEKPSGETVVADGYGQTFAFDEVGTYKIRYDYSDMFYDGVYTAETEVAPNAKPKFENDKLFTNEYYIKNAEYSLLNVKAWNYTAGGSKAVDTKSYVSFDGNPYVEIINPKKFTVTGNAKIKFKTVCASDESVFIESDERDIVDAEYGSTVKIVKYFAGSMTAGIEDRLPVLTAKSSDAYFNFINPLLFSQFGFGFEIPAAADGRKQSVASMTITLTDYFNPENRYEIEISGKNKRYFAAVNGESYSLGEDWNGAKLSIKISGGVLIIGTRNIAVTNPFANDLCFTSVRFNGVSAGFKAKIHEICNQGMTTEDVNSDRVSDEVAPLLYAKLPDKVGSLGQEIVLTRPYATDVLSPASYENLTLTVYKGGKPVRDVNGRELKGITDFESEIKFVLSEYGRYSVTYNYTDGNGKKSSPLSQIITIVDVEAPELKLSDEGKTINVNAGTAFVPKFEATDNVTDASKLKTYFIVKDSNESFVKTVDYNPDDTTAGIVINKPGKYTIIVYVVDEAKNGVSKTYYVNVR